MLILHKGFWFNTAEPSLNILIKMLVVGIVEETVFRGWGYNALCAVLQKRKAMCVSTGLFVVLHWPAYFVRLFLSGSFNWAGFAGQSGAALVWGIICCRLFTKDRSIWSAILAHSIYDFVYTVFVG